jgi:homocysteine S-methyltransferase
VNLDPELWTGGVLLDEPEQLTAVAQSFVDAGADMITTATYQLSLPGLAGRGFAEDEARSVVADAARHLRRAVPSTVSVVGSLGPYGAHLSDGSEYRGDYRLDRQTADRHFRPLMEALTPEVDILAFETIPKADEVRYILELLDRAPNAFPPAWLSLSLRDPETLADGTDLRELAPVLQQSPGLLALGVNCCPPQWVAPALALLASEGEKTLVAYPNLGDHGPSAYLDGRDPARSSFDVGEITRWRELGAGIIGGCCGAGPSEIADLAQLVANT